LEQTKYMCLDGMAVSQPTGDAMLTPVATTGVHHESTNTTYLFYRVKTFNSPMRIMSILLMRARSRQNKS